MSGDRCEITDRGERGIEIKFDERTFDVHPESVAAGAIRQQARDIKIRNEWYANALNELDDKRSEIAKLRADLAAAVAERDQTMAAVYAFGQSQDFGAMYAAAIAAAPKFEAADVTDEMATRIWLAYNGFGIRHNRAEDGRDMIAAVRAELGPALGLVTEEDYERACSSVAFYRRRCEMLQTWQSKMRDPERVIVCDILANGATLDPAGGRYNVPEMVSREELAARVEAAFKESAALWCTDVMQAECDWLESNARKQLESK